MYSLCSGASSPLRCCAAIWAPGCPHHSADRAAQLIGAVGAEPSQLHLLYTFYLPTHSYSTHRRSAHSLACPSQKHSDLSSPGEHRNPSRLRMPRCLSLLILRQIFAPGIREKEIRQEPISSSKRLLLEQKPQPETHQKV